MFINTNLSNHINEIFFSHGFGSSVFVLFYTFWVFINIIFCYISAFGLKSRFILKAILNMKSYHKLLNKKQRIINIRMLQMVINHMKSE